jgi:hypothetical protein
MMRPIFLLLCASVAAAQQPPISLLRPPVQARTDYTTHPPPNAFRGHIRIQGAPQHEAQGAAIAWKTVYVKLPATIDPKQAVVWLENFTHPIQDGLKQRLPEGYAYDPRNVKVTPHFLSFTAPVGDLIFYIVAVRGDKG